MNTRNRGKYLERVIDRCNLVYKQRGIAQINKIPTPIVVRSRGNQIISATYGEKSTVDYVGTLKGGISVAFDTKETKIKRFPFKNVKKHQIEYLTNIHNLGGQAFFLILFVQENELYKVDINQFKQLMNDIDRKSIPYQWFKENLEPITSTNGLIYDYL